MSVYKREERGNHWHYRRVVTLPDGTKQRIQGKAQINTKAAAEAAERAHVLRVLNPAPPEAEKPVAAPTFTEWFEGRFWQEVVIAEGHAPNTQAMRRDLFRLHVKDSVGDLPLSEFDVAAIQRFKTELATKKPARRRGDTLAVATQRSVLEILRIALNYAEEAGVIEQAPRVKAPKARRPDIETWGFDEYLAILAEAEKTGYPWLLAALLAGDAGLRLSEFRGLRWSDIDFAGHVLTVRRQRDKAGVVRETTKGGKSRTVPLSSTLQAALSAAVGSGDAWVVGIDPEALRHGARTLSGNAGLPKAGWHRLRHSFATNCARFRAGPWELQRWLGHSMVTTTERYVHLADAHKRELPGRVATALPDGPIAAIGALSAPALPSEVVSIRRGPSVDPGLRRVP